MGGGQGAQGTDVLLCSMQSSLGGGRLASSPLGACVHGEEAGAPAIREALSTWASVRQAVGRACDSAGSGTSSHHGLTVLSAVCSCRLCLCAVPRPQGWPPHHRRWPEGYGPDCRPRGVQPAQLRPVKQQQDHCYCQAVAGTSRRRCRQCSWRELQVARSSCQGRSSSGSSVAAAAVQLSTAAHCCFLLVCNRQHETAGGLGAGAVRADRLRGGRHQSQLAVLAKPLYVWGPSPYNRCHVSS